MRPVIVENLRKVYRQRGQAPVAALDGVSFELRPGELLVLLGPSGCGKSTTLRSIGGLEQPDEGRIELNGKPVFDGKIKRDVPPEKRGAAMVFQNFALWPHMTVREIVSFPLAVTGGRTAEIAARCDEVLRLVDCSELAGRYPSQLSGGQQQRIALARALAPKPSVVLFDEPLSNLDAGLRVDLRNEVQQAHQTTGFAGVYVTHDQVEALAVADTVAVMRKGRIVQIDRPEVVYTDPADEWIAGFMGYTNRIVGDERLAAVANVRSGNGRFAYRFRPDASALAAGPAPAAPTGDGLAVSGTVTLVTYLGSATQYRVLVGDQTVEVNVPIDNHGHKQHRQGDDVWVRVEPRNLLAFPVGHQELAQAAVSGLSGGVPE